MNQEDFLQVEVGILQSDELDELDLEVITGGDGFTRPVLRPRVQKPGLAFAGYYEYIKPWRVQIIGESEIRYLQSLPPRLREKRVRDISALDVSCYVITKGIEPLPEFRNECEKRSVPLLVSKAMSSQVITRITYFLEEAMAPKLTMHAGLLDVYGIGVLLIGASGVGKSECALDLVSRGHRLIADDSVTVKRHPNDVLLGYTSETIGHHMELRGIGIINIKDLFGVASTRDIKPIDIIVNLEQWLEGAEYDRLGLGGETYECLGVSKPLVRLPVASGRNLALLVEIAARNHLIKMQGYHSADEFARKIDQVIAEHGRQLEEGQRVSRVRPVSGKEVLNHATSLKTKRHRKAR